MSEAETQAQIQLEFSRGDTRLFRTNAGMAWAGTVIKRTARQIVLLNYHPVRLGPEGMSDLCGWSAGAIFTGIEVKYGRNRPTREQLAFIEQVKAAGGRAGVAYSIADARDIIYPR